MPTSTARALLVRARYSIAWRVRSVCHWMWARFVVIPAIVHDSALHPPVFVRSAHGCAVIFSRKEVIKAAAGSGRSLALEANKYREAVRRWPILSEILVPVSLRRRAAAHLLQMDRLQPVAVENMQQHAVHLYDAMRACGQPANGSLDVARFHEARGGIDALTDLFGSRIRRRLEVRLQCAIETGQYDVGFAHGDFHCRNIMLDGAGCPRLIDLDCVRMDGIQQLDALHFVLEAEWLRSRKQWFEQIGDYLRGAVPAEAASSLNRFGVAGTRDLAFVYLLDRMGQDLHNFGFRYHPWQLAVAMTELERGVS